MDPNAALASLRAVCADLVNNEFEWDGDLVEELIDRFGVLDEWLSRGGFLPKAWATTERLVTFGHGECRVIETDYMDMDDEYATYQVFVEAWDDDV